MKKAAIIEFNEYHDECLYSQISFLKKSGYLVTLIISHKIFERAKEYLHLTENIVIYENTIEKNILKKLLWIFSTAKFIKKEKVKTVIQYRKFPV